MNKSKSKKNLHYQKKKIPKKVKEEVWSTNLGNIYESKCFISWCSNKINVFNFHVGHDIPESKGGTDDISNLKPICDRCNLSMGNNNTIKEWNKEWNNKACNYKINKYTYIYLLCISILILSHTNYINNLFNNLFNNLYSHFITVKKDDYVNMYFSYLDSYIYPTLMNYKNIVYGFL